MTWYLRQLDRESQDATAQPVPVPTRGDQFRAGFDEYTITENARFYNFRRTRTAIGTLTDNLGGVDALAPRDDGDRARLGDLPDTRGASGELLPTDWPAQWRALPADRQVDYLTYRASLLAARDPGRVGNLPLDPDQFLDQVKKQQLDELEDALDVLGAGDAVLTRFLGGLTSAATDEISLPLFLASPMSLGPRAGWRFLAQEVAIGAAAETAALPRAQAQAERLDLDDPDVLVRLATGALAGGVLGGAMVGGVRGVDYLRLRRQLEGQARPAGMDGPEYQGRVDRAEQDLRTGTETFAQGQATNRGAVDTDQPFVLGLSGPVDAQSAMIRLPDGTVMTNVRAGDELADGSSVVSVANDRITISRDGETFTVGTGQPLAAPTATVPAPDAPAVQFTRVAQAGNGYTVLVGPDGQAVRREGTRAWRNNNPGNIEFGPFAQSQGAIGTDGRFAVFPDYEAGRRAKEALLWETGSYRGMTIDQAIHRYAPPSENNTGAYVSAVARAVGLPANTPMSALNPAQRRAMLDAMEQVEGFSPGRENGVQVDGPGRATSALDSERAGAFDLGTSRTMTRFDEVTTPMGTRVPVEYQVVDLDSLTPARGEFQPRDRTRGASAEQVSEIAAGLDALRLMPSPEADRGAPIIGPDMMVESGNGRVMALRRAADLHPDRFDAYREAISAAGFDVPEGMKRPALVAMRRGDMTDGQRRAFVAEANDSGTMRMAATEQAGRDADFLTGAVMDAYQPGQPVASQGEFLRRVLGQMPQAERAAMYSADGRLNADGLRRVRQALFARAYGAPDLLRMLTESGDPRLRAMLDMLDDLAPDWAAFRAGVDGGFFKPEFDITDAMIDTVRTIARARTEGRDGQSVIAAIRDRLAQGDMFTDPDADLGAAVLAAFYRDTSARRPADTGDILRRYIADAQTVGRADADDLFGPVRPHEVLREAVKNHEARTAFNPPARVTADDLRVPDTATIDPAPMLDGAASPVLIRQSQETQAALEQAVAPTAPQRAADSPDAPAAPPPAATREAQDAAAVAREFEALRNMTIRLDEQGPEIRVADLIEDLKANAEMADVIQVCNPRRG